MLYNIGLGLVAGGVLVYLKCVQARWDMEDETRERSLGMETTLEARSVEETPHGFQPRR